MKIGLWSDAVNFPSLPLMKLSAYHKARGDTVKLIDDVHVGTVVEHVQTACDVVE
ncbi:hypothetical protein FACS1894219_12590 [Clostridia bacterium]|nr:hypothetical protein FACS1894219_12590 [Clostridia bacterium]